MFLNDCRRWMRLSASTLFLTTTMMFSVTGVFAQSATFARVDHPFLGNRHVVGDFNGDGKLDLAGTGTQSVAIMLGNVDGTFQAKVEFPVGNPTQDLAHGDFNGDGRLDLIVTINDPQIGLSLLTGNGDGTFNAPVNFPNTSHLDSPAVVVTDVDNDGRLDVVIAHAIACFTAPCIVGRTISVMLGNGDGTFKPSREIEVGTGMSSIAVGDFNRDGIKDLGIAGDSAQIYILIGVGDGTFIRQPTITPITQGTIGVDGTDIDIADLNGDAVQDLVVALALNGSRTVILIGNGDGTFRQPSIITEPGTRIPQYQAIGDYNGDGSQDLALSLGWGLQGLMEILNGNGDGTFQPPVLYLVPGPNSSIGGGTLVSADFNSDGKPDIALQFIGASAGLIILRNTTGVGPLALSSLTVTPSSVVSGNTSQGTVTLTRAATSNTVVALSSSNTAAATVPASVAVPSGATRANFTVTSRSVTSSTPVTISASFGGVSKTARLTVTPPPTPSAPSLISPANAASVAQPVTFDWSEPNAAVSYRIQIDDASTFTTPLLLNQAVTPSEFTATSLPARRLWWRVRAINSAGTAGPWSATREFTVKSVAPSLPTLSTLTLSPSSIVGGSASQGTVTLTGAAPTGGAVATLSSSNIAAATVPANVTVAAGATSVNFTVTSKSVTASTAVTITGSFGGVTRTATLTVTPQPPPPPPGGTATLTVTATGRSGERVTSSPTGINVAVGSSGSASFTTSTSITLSVTNGRDSIWSGACSSGGNKSKTCTFTLNSTASVTGNVQ